MAPLVLERPLTLELFPLCLVVRPEYPLVLPARTLSSSFMHIFEGIKRSRRDDPRISRVLYFYDQQRLGLFPPSRATAFCLDLSNFM